MQLDSRKLLALLIILTIALLPFRFGHTMDDDKASFANSFSNHSHVSEGGHSNQTDLSNDCGDHSPDETSSDDCCSDHCSSTYFFVGSVFDLLFSAFQTFHPVFSQRFPESLVVAKFRPPITIFQSSLTR